MKTQYKIIGLIILSLIINLSCNQKYNGSVESLVTNLKKNDKKLEPPKEGEWLFSHKEKGQTFKQYISSDTKDTSNLQNTIYLLPIGHFDSIHYRLIIYTKNYLQVFFQRDVKILDVLNDEIIPDSAKRIHDGHTQFIAQYILDNVIPQKKPDDALAVMALTESDLYPQPSWNFIFGLASYTKQIGVTSMYRYSNYNIDSTNYELALNRLVKVSSHEIGHMFSLHHCINAHCTMNGSNGLTELDKCPNRLCSECTAKLAWKFNFDNHKRLFELQDFFEKHKMNADLNIIKKDIKVLYKK